MSVDKIKKEYSVYKRIDNRVLTMFHHSCSESRRKGEIDELGFLELHDWIQEKMEAEK